MPVQLQQGAREEEENTKRTGWQQCEEIGRGRLEVKGYQAGMAREE